MKSIPPSQKFIFNLLEFQSTVFFLVFYMDFRPQVVFAHINRFPNTRRTEVVWKLLGSVFGVSDEFRSFIADFASFGTGAEVFVK